MKNRFFMIIGIIFALIIGLVLGNIYGDKHHSFSTNDGVNGVAVFENISDEGGYGIEFEKGLIPLNIAIYNGTLHLKIVKGEKTIYEEDFDKWQDITVDIPETGFYQVLLSGKNATGIVKYPVYENSETENSDIISEIFDNNATTISNSDAPAGEVVFKNFEIQNAEPEIILDDWKEKENNLWYKKITNYSEYKKLMDNYSNLRKLTESDFENYFAVIVLSNENQLNYKYLTYDNNVVNIEMSYGEKNNSEIKYNGLVVIMDKSKLEYEIDLKSSN